MIKTLLALVCFTSTAYANDCYELKAEWPGGMLGNFLLKPNEDVDGWDTTVTFNGAFNSFQVFNGDNAQCSGQVCTFADKGWNGFIGAGNTYQLEFMLLFSGPTPTVNSLVLNGVEICGDGGGDAPWPHPTTQEPNTPEPVTTQEPDATTQEAVTTEGPESTTAEQSDNCNDITNNYSEVIRLSLLFYEAQRSGKLPDNQRVTWRKDSAENDGQDVGLDLSGGYYDAGDYVKFGFPMAWTITTLAWGGLRFKDGYDSAGQFGHLLEALKWGTDYFIKAHPSPNVFYGQVGDGNLDHAWFGRPEDMTMSRPSMKIDSSNGGGSDLAGETAAAMASTAMIFKDSDPEYAEELIGHARDLFDLADNYRGKYTNAIPNAANFYNSFSGYKDELIWAALWLHKATGEQTYLDKAKSMYDEFGIGTGWYSWDDKGPGVQVLMAEAFPNEQKYQWAIKGYCDNAVSGQTRSPLGQLFYNQWGSLRQASNTVFICLLAADIMADRAEAYTTLAEGQMDYILGKTGRSFVVGYGVNPPVRPHHRSSTCPSTGTCDWNTYNGPQPNAHVLYGALVGGPKAADDQYEDDRSDYIMNEVATDYNAGFQGVLAGLQMKKCM